jgi:hypothetical protein
LPSPRWEITLTMPLASAPVREVVAVRVGDVSDLPLPDCSRDVPRRFDW